MNRSPLILFFSLLALLAPARAEVPDAFEGIYPVTDRTRMQSLNGTWVSSIFLLSIHRLCGPKIHFSKRIKCVKAHYLKRYRDITPAGQ